MSQQIETTVGVIDDNIGLLRAIQRLDKSLDGLQFMTSSDPDLAVQWVRERRVSALACDLKMPKRSGIEVLRQVRVIDKSIPIMLYTGGDLSPAEQIEVTDLGASSYRKSQGILDLVNDLADLAKGAVATPARTQIANDAGQTDTELLAGIIEEFVAHLERIPDKTSKTIVFGGRSLSVNDLIYEVRARTGIGIEHVRLWVRALGHSE